MRGETERWRAYELRRLENVLGNFVITLAVRSDLVWKRFGGSKFLIAKMWDLK